MTVAELIAKLLTFDQSLRVAVEDADTQWCAPVVNVTVMKHPEGETFAVIDPCGYPDMLGRFNL